MDTETRAKATRVPIVDLERVDVRVALKKLFREHRFGVTIAPDVTGTVSLKVQNFNLLEIVKILVREVDATYRIEHGWFEISSKHDDSFAKWLVHSHIGPKEVQGLYPQAQAWRPSPVVQITRWKSKPIREFEASVRYVPHHGPPFMNRDTWREIEGVWVKTATQRNAKIEPLRFEKVAVSQILKALGERGDFEWVLDVSVENAVTVDLTGLSFAEAFARTLKAADATFELGDGFVHVVPHAYGPWDQFQAILSTVKLVKVPIREALRIYMARSGVSYTVDLTVDGVVTADWTCIGTETALQRLLTQIGATYRSGGGVIQIVRREP